MGGPKSSDDPSIDGKIKVYFTLCFLSWLIPLTRFSLLVSLSASPEATNSTTIGTKVDHLINLISYFLQCLEHLVLLHGIYRFICYVLGDKDDSTCKTCCCCYCSTTGVDLEIWKTIKDNFCPDCECTLCSTDWWKIICSTSEPIDYCCKCCTFAIISIIMTIIHLIISLVPPSLLIHWREDTVEFYDRNPNAGTAYAAIAIFDHLYNFMMRTTMAYITLYVMCAWKKAAKEVNQEINNITKGDMKKLVVKYHLTGEMINAVQSIFQGWFVVKWLVYFINITGDSVLAAGILLSDNRRGDEYEDHQLKFILIYLAYDFAAFFFLFFCGSVMNHYHAIYRKKQARLLREKLSESDERSFYLMQGSDNLISEVPEYQFLPTVLWIHFPLSSPGYILSMLLSLIAFIANFLTQYS